MAVGRLAGHWRLLGRRVDSVQLADWQAEAAAERKKEPQMQRKTQSTVEYQSEVLDSFEDETYSSLKRVATICRVKNVW